MKRIYVLFLVVTSLALNSQGKTWFVASDGTGDGSEWSQAASLTDALAGASAGDELWLAEGNYINSALFAVTGSDLTIYGGFTTAMTDFSQRDWQAYPTVLDGEGARQVMSVTSDGVLIDGLVFTNASTSTTGAGITKTGSGSLTVANSVFTGNKMTGTSGVGAGIYAGAGSLTVINCTFTNNTGSTYARGAGLYATGGGRIALQDCLFCNNKAGTQGKNGGAVYVKDGTLEVIGCVFRSNATAGMGDEAYGGAVSLSGNLNSWIKNCVFDGNVAGKGGAIIIWTNQNYTSVVENCTFAGTNRAAFTGGAIHVDSGTVLASNSIFWGSSGFAGRNIYNKAGIVSAAFCCFDTAVGSFAGDMSVSNCFYADPLFAGDGDFHLRSSQGRWHPESGSWVTDTGEYSPCIDQGDPAADYSFEPLNNGYRLNLGAYGNTPEASKSLVAVTPIVNNAPAEVSHNSVSMKGTLSAGGQACVTVYYGLSDGGTDIGSWESSLEVSPSPRTGEMFSVGRSSLLPNQVYYYRCLAGNAVQTNWAPGSASFTTGSAAPSGGAGVIHVDGNATGPCETGQDWVSAYRTLSEGIWAVNEQTNEIWVAQGRYIEALRIEEGMSIYGGFTGTETSRSERNAANEVLLDGEGSRTIMQVSNTDPVILDSLTFSNAYSVKDPIGAGLYKTGSGHLEVANSTFKKNYVTGTGAAGGGAYFQGGSVLISNCLFTANTCGSYCSGDGFYSTGADVVCIDCVFRSNGSSSWDTYGGAFVHNGGMLDVIGCLFETNIVGTSANSSGGAVRVIGSSSARFKNCVFRGNRAPTNAKGGAISVAANASSTTIVENCTFAGTNTAAYGGALYVGSGVALIKNSILWNNVATTNGSEIYATGASSKMEASYTCITGTGEPHIVLNADASIELGEGILEEDPLFASALDLHLMSKGGRWDPELQDWMQDAMQSPCIDAGDPLDPFADEPMPNGRRINMGAYGGTAHASKSFLSKVSMIKIR